MKKLLIALLMISFATVASAQIGVKAGVNFANMVFEEDEQSIQDLTKDGLVGLTGGVSFIIPLGGNLFALQPEVLYTRKGSQRNYTVLGEEYSNKLMYNYIDVPILLRVSLGNTYGESLGIYLNGGPYLGFVLSGKSENETPFGNTETEFTFDDEDNQSRLDYGLSLGGGITIGNLFLEARYNHGINNLLDDDANNNNDNFDKLQHRGFALTAGLIF
jgi:hypothetical protein